MTETDSEYKLAVILSVPKAPLKEDVAAALEDANLFALLEVEQTAIEDHIMDAVNLSPATKAMVELVEGKWNQKQYQEEWIKNLSKAAQASLGPKARALGKSTIDPKQQIHWETPEKRKK